MVACAAVSFVQMVAETLESKALSQNGYGLITIIIIIIVVIIIITMIIISLVSASLLFFSY